MGSALYCEYIQSTNVETIQKESNLKMFLIYSSLPAHLS